MHLKFDLTGAQTHDFQIMNSIFHVTEMLISTTASSVTAS